MKMKIKAEDLIFYGLVAAAVLLVLGRKRDNSDSEPTYDYVGRGKRDWKGKDFWIYY